MFRTHAHRSMDMTEGPLMSKVLFFSLPIMLSGILQLVFNAADTIVVGRFAGNEALAAVGSVGSLRTGSVVSASTGSVSIQQKTSICLENAPQVTVILVFP